MNILIIDDEEDLLEILTNALKRANFTVTSAASSVDAMRALRFPKSTGQILSSDITQETGVYRRR